MIADDGWTHVSASNSNSVAGVATCHMALSQCHSGYINAVDTFVTNCSQLLGVRNCHSVTHQLTPTHPSLRHKTPHHPRRTHRHSHSPIA